MFLKMLLRFENWAKANEKNCNVSVSVPLFCVSQVKNDEDEDDGVVKYENFGDSSVSVSFHWSTTSTITSTQTDTETHCM